MSESYDGPEMTNRPDTAPVEEETVIDETVDPADDQPDPADETGTDDDAPGEDAPADEPAEG